MSGVLDELVHASRARAIANDLPEPARAPRRGRLVEALRGRDRIALIAEFKRRSPSAPALAPDAELAPQLQGYVAAGAAAVSVLTEPTRFGGDLADLRQAVRESDLPILRKDFLVRPEQLAEAARAGAAAALLIVRCLPDGLLGEMVAACRDASIDALVECHDADELQRALAFEDVVLGINNRDLDTLRIDRAVTARLAPTLPHDRIVVAESGYDDPRQLGELHGHVDAVLIGSALMRGGLARAFVGGAR